MCAVTVVFASRLEEAFYGNENRSELGDQWLEDSLELKALGFENLF